MNDIGSGSPRNVPKARRMMRSASVRSPSLNGRTETSDFTSTTGVLLSSTQPHHMATITIMTACSVSVKNLGTYSQVGGELPLFTENPRRLILGNSVR